tara:strand:- start:83 stop:331 length:249 start_codon:yes stop_codon:yes gene_type:complete
VPAGQRVGNFFGGSKGEVGSLIESFNAKKNELKELIKSKEGKSSSRGGSSHIQKRVKPSPNLKAPEKKNPAYDFAAFMDNLD